jgi:hypothetical protein
VVPYPQVHPQKPVTPVYGYAFAVNPQIPEAKQKLVHDLLRHVTKSPKEWYDKTTYPYPAANFLELPGIEEARKTRYLDVFLQGIKEGRFVQRSPKILEINDALHRAMERVVLRGENPKASLDQACKEIDAALAQP